VLARRESHRQSAYPAPEQEKGGRQAETIADRKHRVDSPELEFDGDPGRSPDKDRGDVEKKILHGGISRVV